MQRRTKIVTTLGPSSESEEVIEKLMIAGANVFRLNFSHGEPQDHINRATIIRKISKKLKKYVAILGDLQGPKIRISTFKNKKVNIKKDATFTLDTALEKGQGDVNQVGCEYKDLPNDVEPKDILLLDDGRIVLEVLKIKDSQVVTKVIFGGVLSDKKGINKKGGGLSADALTQKDKDDIITAAQIDVDYLAISFPRCAKDIELARALTVEAGFSPQLVAKIERAEVVADDKVLDDIIKASDALMVARGDLGVEIGDAELIAQQKKIISRSRHLDKVVITATQMMESMITSPTPTRAEVMDVANAVLDGTDAVMLSAETASGDYPVETVLSMADVCKGAEKHPRVKHSRHRINEKFESYTDLVAMSAMYAAHHLKDVKAIVGLTNTGNTPRMMSRITSGLPIFGLSKNEKSLAKMALYRGVKPVFFDPEDDTKVVEKVINCMVQKGHLQKGDKIIMTKGDVAISGSSNTIKVLIV